MTITNKRPKGNEKLSEFIKRRINEIEQQENSKANFIKNREKGIIEKELIKQGYWPEEDTHHDVIRATLILKSITVGIYAASLMMVFYVYAMFVVFRSENNPAYDVYFMYGDLFHYLEAEYIFFYPLFTCLCYKMMWIHIPRMWELKWHKMIPDRKKAPLTIKINKYMNYYMFFAAITLNSYGKSLMIYLTTYDMWDFLELHNNDLQPLFNNFEIYLLKSTGMWLELEITFEAKYYTCCKFIIDEITVPEPVKDYYNPRIGILVNPWLHMETEPTKYPEDIFFGGLTKENPGHIPTLFKTIRTEGPQAAKEQFYLLYKDEIENYNQEMKNIQEGICHAYGERKPLVAGQFPISRYTLSKPYPIQWLKEMAEGKR